MKNDFICINEKGEHLGKHLKVIQETVSCHRSLLTCEIKHVVQWCSICGGIVIDRYIEGTLTKGEIRFPQTVFKNL